MSRIHHSLRCACVALCLLFGGLAYAQVAPIAETRGSIDELRFADNTMLIGGTLYSVSSAARVEIGGTYGAFTMLKEGMNVDVEFYQFNDGTREIIMIRELLRGEVVEES